MAWYDALIPVLGTIASSYIGAQGSERAGETAAEGSAQAAQLQRQTAQEVMDLQRQLLNYQSAQDSYNRQQAERFLGLQIGQYGDQYGLTQRTFDLMGNQIGYGNQLRQNAMTNLQNFANLGLGSLGGLASMTGQSGAGLTGPRAFNVQAPGPIAPLGPSQVNYNPIDTESLIQEILNNPSFTFSGPSSDNGSSDNGGGTDDDLSDSDLGTLIENILGESGVIDDNGNIIPSENTNLFGGSDTSGGYLGRPGGLTSGGGRDGTYLGFDPRNFSGEADAGGNQSASDFGGRTDAPQSDVGNVLGSTVLGTVLGAAIPGAGVVTGLINTPSFRDMMFSDFGIDLDGLAFGTPGSVSDVATDLGWGSGFGGFGGQGGIGDLGGSVGPAGDYGAGYGDAMAGYV